MSHDIRTTIVFDVETSDGYPMQFRYNGSLTINVYTGLIDDDGEFIDPVEIDVITLSEPSLALARSTVEEWVDGFELMPEGCGKWGCKDCYPDEE